MPTVHETLIQAIELQNQGRLAEAAALFEAVLQADSVNIPALYSLALIALQAGRAEEALVFAERGCASAPTYAPIWCVRAGAEQGLGQKEAALASYDQALLADPANQLALLNSAVLLRELFRHAEAVERTNRLVALDPGNVSAIGNLGIMLSEFRQHREAASRFAAALALDPNYEWGLGLFIYERLHLCDWTDLPETSARISAGILAGRRVCKTLALMSLTDSAALHYLDARIFARARYPRRQTPLWRGERYGHARLRVAYVSPDLREHPVGHLMAGIFEQHDKSRIETIGIFLGAPDASALHQRIRASLDHFVEAKAMSSLDIARLMRQMEVDVAVDLAGYTSDSRTDLFAWRPAPVHVNYLGYPGTLGVDYMDFILADATVIPPEHEVFYSEEVVRLPDAYLPAAAGIHISAQTPSRAECGLPEEAFVFCSFSHDYKVSPPLFDLWMRLLLAVPGSVLWLMSRNPESQTNLRAAAQARGVAAERLIFAGRVPRVEDHLARYRQADLFLDTHPYNAHTTCADALKAGLPVVACLGGAFPARVAASLLHAAGLPELVAPDFPAYEALALELAKNPEKRAAVRQKLAANLATAPFGDPLRFARKLEAAYFDMLARVCG